MSCPVDVSLAPLPALSDALRRVAATDRAVCGPRACNRNRRSRPHRSRTNAVSNFASTDAKKVHPPLEQKESTGGSREFPVQRLSPTPLSLRFLSEILELPGPRRRSRYLPADFPAKRILLKQYPALFRSRSDSPRRKSVEQLCPLTCRQPLPSPFQGYGTPVLPAQERCLHR